MVISVQRRGCEEWEGRREVKWWRKTRVCWTRLAMPVPVPVPTADHCRLVYEVEDIKAGHGSGS